MSRIASRACPLAGCLSVLAWLLAAVPSAAQPAAPVADPAGAGWFWTARDLYSHGAFAFNRMVYDALSAARDWAGGSGAAGAPNAADTIPHGLGPVLSNLVNEPVTALASLMTGDTERLRRAATRFGINSTAGVLGWYDEAGALGYAPAPQDVGLALCRMGVGEGGYVVVPFIGPRTVRDAVADVVLVNAILWTATGALLGSGLSTQTIVVAEAVEIVGDITATRQIDPLAKALDAADYDATRDAYLAQRRARCAAGGAL